MQQKMVVTCLSCHINVILVFVIELPGAMCNKKYCIRRRCWVAVLQVGVAASTLAALLNMAYEYYVSRHLIYVEEISVV